MDMSIPSKNKELNYNLYQDTNWTWDHITITITPGHFPPVRHPCGTPSMCTSNKKDPYLGHTKVLSRVMSWIVRSAKPVAPSTKSNQFQYLQFVTVFFFAILGSGNLKKKTKAPKIPIFRVFGKGWVRVEVSFLGAEIENREEVNFEVWIEWKSIWRCSSSKNTGNEWTKRNYLLPFHCLAPLTVC